MAPKKKTRNSKTKKDQDDVPRAPFTIPCQHCGEDIIVPKACKHGKKLINCQGTGCTTAHLEEHNATCAALSTLTASTRPRVQTESTGGRKTALHDVPEDIVARWDDGSPITETQIQRLRLHTMKEENERLASMRAATPTTMTPERLQAMAALTVQLNATIKTRGGKAVRYLEGIPFTEWFANMENGPSELADEWIEKLKEVVKAKKTVEEIGYDDEESEGDGEACHTPPDDNEGDSSFNNTK